MKNILLAALVTALATGLTAADDKAKKKDDAKKEEGWVQLFNGKNLDGWIPKIRYHKAGENFGNTFRVEDGVMKVGYEKYDEFGERFGQQGERLPVDDRGIGCGCGRDCRPFSGGQNPGKSGRHGEDTGQEKHAATCHCRNSFKRSRGRDVEPVAPNVADP